MRIIITLQDLSLADITPQNLKNDPEISAVIRALDPELQEITSLTGQAALISRVSDLDAPALDFLASQFHTDFYDLAGNLEMKRNAVKNSILWHMHKGTSWAILEALKALGICAEFQHWKDFNGAPYTFRIKAEITGDFYRTAGRDKIISRIRDAIEQSKAARSHLVGLETEIKFQENTNIFAGSLSVLGGQEIIRLKFPDLPGASEIYSGLASLIGGNRKIFPARVREIPGKIYHGVLSYFHISQEVGPDLKTMQELLNGFEARIFQKMDGMKQDINLKIDAKFSELDAKFNALADLLRWKGDDEEL